MPDHDNECKVDCFISVDTQGFNTTTHKDVWYLSCLKRLRPSTFRKLKPTARKWELFLPCTDVCWPLNLSIASVISEGISRSSCHSVSAIRILLHLKTLHRCCLAIPIITRKPKAIFCNSRTRKRFLRPTRAISSKIDLLAVNSGFCDYQTVTT